MASIDWQQKTFKIATQNGSEDVAGWVGGPFGIREIPGRWRSVWSVTHLTSGLRLTPGSGAGFSSIALAQAFAERLLTLRSACGVVLVSVAFGVAWVTVLRAAGVQLGAIPTMDAVWMLSPTLLPLMACVLAPWSLGRVRHM